MRYIRQGHLVYNAEAEPPTPCDRTRPRAVAESDHIHARLDVETADNFHRKQIRADTNDMVRR